MIVYRRTLYWNPNLKLDARGKAQVQFYNNARLSIDTAGLLPDGTIPVEQDGVRFAA